MLKPLTDILMLRPAYYRKGPGGNGTKGWGVGLYDIGSIGIYSMMMSRLFSSVITSG